MRCFFRGRSLHGPSDIAICCSSGYSFSQSASQWASSPYRPTLRDRHELECVWRKVIDSVRLLVRGLRLNTVGREGRVAHHYSDEARVEKEDRQHFIRIALHRARHYNGE